jgi:hypothetical protein
MAQSHDFVVIKVNGRKSHAAVARFERATILLIRWEGDWR